MLSELFDGREVIVKLLEMKQNYSIITTKEKNYNIITIKEFTLYYLYYHRF